MARTYRRDSNGRFSSGGGSARGVKATTAARKAAMVKEVSSAALKGKKTSASRTSYVRSQQQAKMAAASGRGKGSKAARKAATVQAKATQAARAKAFSSKTTNKARDAYKAATSKAREAKMLAGGRTSTRGVKNAGLRTTVKAAQAAAAKVRAMEKNRGRKRTSRKKG